jgi:hypothetical protein
MSVMDQNIVLRHALKKSLRRIEKLEKANEKLEKEKLPQKVALVATSIAALSGFGYFGSKKLLATLAEVRTKPSAAERSQAFLTIISSLNDESESNSDALMKILVTMTQNQSFVFRQIAKKAFINRKAFLSALVAFEQAQPGILYKVLLKYGRHTLYKSVDKGSPDSLLPPEKNKNAWTDEQRKLLDESVHTMLTTIAKAEPQLLNNILAALLAKDLLPPEVAYLAKPFFADGPEPLIHALAEKHNGMSESFLSSIMIHMMRIVPEYIENEGFESNEAKKRSGHEDPSLGEEKSPSEKLKLVQTKKFVDTFQQNKQICLAVENIIRAILDLYPQFPELINTIETMAGLKQYNGMLTSFKWWGLIVGSSGASFAAVWRVGSFRKLILKSIAQLIAAEIGVPSTEAPTNGIA